MKIWAQLPEGVSLRSRVVMRFIAQVVTVILMSVAVDAQQPQPSTPPKPTSSAEDGTQGQPAKGKEPADLDLPVSLDKIREALAQPSPSEPLKGMNEQPTFRTQVQERQRFEQLMESIKFDTAGPVVPGGRDAYDQQQRLFPRVDNPRLQPYGAFSTGEILTLGVEAFVEKYVAQKLAHVFSETLRAQAEREARDEVARSLAGFWAAQPAAPAQESKP
jgi:hypothetical protein